MADFRDNVTLIIKWLSEAIKKAIAIVNEDSDQTQKNQRVGELLTDTQTVVNAHLICLQNFVPARPIRPWPKNFWSQLSWVKDSLPWIQIIVALTQGDDPFAEARELARNVATKWGFYHSVYGGR